MERRRQHIQLSSLQNVKNSKPPASLHDLLLSDRSESLRAVVKTLELKKKKKKIQSRWLAVACFTKLHLGFLVTNMRTRNGDSAKSTPTKKTPPTRKIATRATSTPAETKRDSGSKAKQAKSNETTPPQVTPSSGSSLEHSAGIILSFQMFGTFN